MMRVPETSVVVVWGEHLLPPLWYCPLEFWNSYACTLCTCILCVCTVGSSEAASDSGVPQARHHGQAHQTAIKAGAPRYIHTCTYSM